MENTTNEPNTPIEVKKEPLLAAVGSFLFPGLGQVYNGEGMVKGLMYLIGTLIGLLIFILPGLAIWLYGIFNAYKVADNMKSGTIPGKRDDDCEPADFHCRILDHRLHLWYSHIHYVICNIGCIYLWDQQQ